MIRVVGVLPPPPPPLLLLPFVAWIPPVEPELVAAFSNDDELVAERPLQFSSTLVKNRTWPVWPYGIPVKLDTMCCSPFVELDTGRFSSTPALVPIQSRSLQASNEVIRKQAALCWRMMSSQLDSILFTGLLTSISNNSSWLRGDHHQQQRQWKQSKSEGQLVIEMGMNHREIIYHTSGKSPLNASCVVSFKTSRDWME